MEKFFVVYAKQSKSGESIVTKEVYASNPLTAANKVSRRWKTGTTRQELIEVQYPDGQTAITFD